MQGDRIPEQPIPLPHAPGLALATDLDGTFLGGDEQQRRSLYTRLREHADELLLVFVTGRDLDFVAELTEQPGMPTPDLIIGDVGTTVVHGHDLSPVTEVQDWVDGRWNDADARVRTLLDGEPGLELQPVMGTRRVSYFYDPAELRAGTVRKVEEAGFDVILSADLYLDVLPRGVAKGPTLTRLVDLLGLPRDRVLVAGDTLNDLSLFHTGFRGVAVGNSEPRLLEAIADLPDVCRPQEPGCAGIERAIDHFGFLSPEPTAVTARPAVPATDHGEVLHR